MKTSTVKDLATETYNDYRSEKGDSVKATEKEAREIVERALKSISRRHQDGEFSASDLLRYFENAAN